MYVPRWSIAAGEIGATIIEHTGGRQPVVIRMGSELVGDQVHVTFTDNGPPADIDLSAGAMPDATAERGRGLALTPTALDQLAYRCDDLATNGHSSVNTSASGGRAPRGASGCKSPAAPI